MFQNSCRGFWNARGHQPRGSVPPPFLSSRSWTNLSESGAGEESTGLFDGERYPYTNNIRPDYRCDHSLKTGFLQSSFFRKFQENTAPALVTDGLRIEKNFPAGVFSRSGFRSLNIPGNRKSTRYASRQRSLRSLHRYPARERTAVAFSPHGCRIS